MCLSKYFPFAYDCAKDILLYFLIDWYNMNNTTNLVVIL